MTKLYMRSRVQTRITVACEILYPQYEETTCLPEDRNMKDVFWYAKTYVRDAVHNGADYACVDVYEVYDQEAYSRDPYHMLGRKMYFRIEAQDTYYHEGERVQFTYASNSAYCLLGQNY